MNTIPLGIYRHYKGTEYELLAIGTHSETLEPMAIYRAHGGAAETWVRPLSMWANPIALEHGTVPRFTYVGATAREGE